MVVNPSTSYFYQMPSYQPMSLIIRNVNIALHLIFFLMVSPNIIFASGVVKILEME